MAGLSRPKDGVASLAYVPAIHVLLRGTKNVDARDKPGHDEMLVAKRRATRKIAPRTSLAGYEQFVRQSCGKLREIEP